MKQIYSFLFVLFIGIHASCFSHAQSSSEGYAIKEDIFYRTEAEAAQDEYLAERCKLDVYYPVNSKDYITVVWFHGGGIKAGNKHIPDKLKEKGIAVVDVNYRLHPKVQCPAYIEDAAAAVAWTLRILLYAQNKISAAHNPSLTGSPPYTTCAMMPPRWC